MHAKRTQKDIDFNRIAAAISFFRDNFRRQPDLEAVAAHVQLSPFHFQRMFSEWAGVTPKQFLQFVTVQHARKLLHHTQSTLFDTAMETGLSSTGRLHDLFIRVEGMTPGEYKNGGEALHINYHFAETPFGEVIVASTGRGICYLAFTEGDSNEATQLLVATFPRAGFSHRADSLQEKALAVFQQDWKRPEEVRLHLKASPFRIKVWETLLSIPSGGLTTYATLATKAGYPGASRAVGTAVASNPVAVLIPCHRVIKSTGETGQYHWGSGRKSAINGWEACVSMSASGQR